MSIIPDSSAIIFFLSIKAYHFNLRYTGAVIPLKHRTYTEIRNQYAPSKKRILSKMKRKTFKSKINPLTKKH